MTITGTTRVFFVLGHPVAQVRAPEVFNPLFAAHGVDAVLVPAQVAPDRLAAFVQGTLGAHNMDGLWLTIPHKTAVMDLLQHSDRQAQRAGAVNALRRNADGSLEGALFDGLGLAKALDHLQVRTTGQRVLLLGTGGAGMAIAAALCERPLGELALFDALPGRADMAVQRLRAGGSVAPLTAAVSNDAAGFDVIVHATPLGLNADDPLPLDVARIAPHATVVDILMKRQPTALQRACEARGLTVHPGFEMLAQQVPEYLRFFGFEAMAEAVALDLAPVRQRLTALA
ncbi:MAG: hypothetical protein RJA98_868 [Pseudomonadota bacterium]|jgi:shikimate dehydrogenase